jgi:hypothetical protein
MERQPIQLMPIRYPLLCAGVGNETPPTSTCCGIVDEDLQHARLGSVLEPAGPSIFTRSPLFSRRTHCWWKAIVVLVQTAGEDFVEVTSRYTKAWRFLPAKHSIQD